MLNVYHFIYRQYGFEMRPTSKDYTFWEWLSATNRLEKWLKWKTANMLSRAVRSPILVPNPFHMDSIPPLFDGFFRPDHLGLFSNDQGFHRMKLARRNRNRYAQFVFSLYQGKAASLPAQGWKVSAAVRDTIDRLTSESRSLGTLITPAGPIDEDRLEEELFRTVDELFPTLRDRPASYRLPSFGACLTSGRSTGGSLGLLSRLSRGVEKKDFYLPVGDFLVGFMTGPYGVYEIRTTLDPLDYQETLMDWRLQTLATDRVGAIPVGLVEPFKVRVITKGDPAMYALARDYQPRVWGLLKENPTFRLIGESIGPRAMCQIASEVGSEEDVVWLSGDYREATDHIPGHMAEAMAWRVFSRLGVPIEHQSPLVATLTQHRLKVSPDDPGVDQRKGQLMGSPTSFPFLCLYNAAITRLAIETADVGLPRKSLDSYPMLVNGDDLLLACSPDTYSNWERVVAWAGLYPSVGKTLVSRQFATINSTLYRMYPRFSHGTEWIEPFHLPHVQLQLAIGSMKSGHTDHLSSSLSMSDPCSDSRMWHEFLASCPDQERAWRFLYGANRNYIRSLCQGFPTSALCLPPEAGGLGFPLPPATSVYYPIRKPRPYDLLLGRMLLEEGTQDHNRLRGQWLSTLKLMTLESPVQRLVMQDWMRAQRHCASEPVFLPREEVPDFLPPPSLAVGLASNPVIDWTDIDLFRQRRRIRFQLDRAVLSYSRSGRGPPDLRSLQIISRRGQWAYRYTDFSS